MSNLTHERPILVVDDDDSIVETILLALEDEGLVGIKASNGAEAADLVTRDHPALVLLDISMPVMDGREFNTWLRSNGHATIPVVVMTAGTNACRTCRELGAQGYLAKPFDLDDLLSHVHKLAQPV